MPLLPHLEVCIDTPAGLTEAVRGGADRIELCAALSEGGLTPSPGLMRLAAAAPCPVRAMIRPRPGGFVYDAGELDAMRYDIDAVRAAGLAGIVIGACLPDGRADAATLHRLVRHATGLEIALHRAADLSPDPLETVELAAELGIATLLTSGGALRAEEALPRIAAMVRQAAGRIEIMPGSGINATNARHILAETGADWLHASCARPLEATADEVRLGLLPPDAKITDAALVRGLRARMRDNTLHHHRNTGVPS